MIAAGMNRREFLRRSALGGAAALTGTMASGCSTASWRETSAAPVKPFELEEISIAEVQLGLASGRFSAVGLARSYLRRIEEVDRNGPRLGSVLS